MFVRPAENMIVLDPADRRPLPAAGKEVPDTTYWRRRIACGDVVVVLNRFPIPVSPEVAP